ncbi:hypothetical protein acdb102_42430 [Acidothermaceae bacterium B102]|nr:hypothetical protein acdb102_42430 [Acidothermaceae bacterium B102]
MALHPALLDELLDLELDRARARLGERAGDLHREGPHLLMTLTVAQRSWQLRLDGTRFDAEPYDVALVDTDGDVLPLEDWIPGFAHGIHTSLQVPWVCVNGTRAYYAHESHFKERWDHDRATLRADSLLLKLLAKAGL